MASFLSSQTLRFIPESYLPTAPYIPSHFIAQPVVLDAANFEYEIDERGQASIIRLMMDDNIVVPFVDLTKYDSETKDWFWYDIENKFPYRYNKSTNTLDSIYPSEYSSLVPTGVFYFNKESDQLRREAVSSTGVSVLFYKYSPLLLTENNEAYNDLSDYSTFKSSDRLNKTNSTVPEYYYDFDSRIYTNRNLAGIDPAQVKIHFFKISDNSLQVKCRMSTNQGIETYYTPKVDHFIIKLKGQSLRI